MFLLCSMFSTIILLNMLVAIMGEAFNRVNEQADSQREREHLQLIVENNFLYKRELLFGDVKYLIEIRDDQDQGDKEGIAHQLNQFGKKMKNRHQKLHDEFAEMKNLLKYLNS
jgi:hypothetical protein